ncbi:MAG: aldo/keto reductase [Desulfurococcales archaeon]|nr:aldo/keto reductase [Desulfurococcales archaeon]
MTKIEYTELGSTGIRISRIGLGAWQFSQSWGVTDYEKAKAIIARALDLGINLVDTAIVYGRGLSEEFIGRALRELGVKRDDVVIATKIPGEMLSYDDVFKATRRSLRRLQTSYVDLMQVHWPPCWNNIPTCEYMRALERLQAKGLIGAIGLSDFPVELIESARACLARSDIEAIQVRFNIAELEAEKEHIPYAEENDLTLLAWSPLAKGAVLGKYTLEEAAKLSDVRANDPLFHPENYAQILELAGEIKKLAEKYEKTPAQIALNWLLAYSDTIVPIPGAKTPEQVEDNAGAMGWRLEQEDWLNLYEKARKLRITRVTF